MQPVTLSGIFTSAYCLGIHFSFHVIPANFRNGKTNFDGIFTGNTPDIAGSKLGYVYIRKIIKYFHNAVAI